MPKRKHRYLFLFSASHDYYNDQEDSILVAEIDEQITYCKSIIRRIEQHSHSQPEWHLLYVMPKIPTHALRCNELAELYFSEQEQAQGWLSYIGDQLIIQPGHRHLRSGFADFEAYMFAKQRHIHSVIGYSNNYLKFMRKVHMVKQQIHHYHKHWQNACEQLNWKHKQRIHN